MRQSVASPNQEGLDPHLKHHDMTSANEVPSRVHYSTLKLPTVDTLCVENESIPPCQFDSSPPPPRDPQISAFKFN